MTRESSMGVAADEVSQSSSVFLLNQIGSSLIVCHNFAHLSVPILCRRYHEYYAQNFQNLLVLALHSNSGSSSRSEVECDFELVASEEEVKEASLIVS